MNSEKAALLILRIRETQTGRTRLGNRRLYLPLYGADYSLIDRYDFDKLALRTDIPATIFYSEEDTPLAGMELWRRYFVGKCEFIRLKGNHFFMLQHSKEMSDMISERKAFTDMRMDDLLQIQPYSLAHGEKERLLTERLAELTELHRRNCPEYRAILDAMGYDPGAVRTYRDLPFLPVRLFKELSLKSVPQEEIVKTITSSGTSGQAVSRIYLDRTTSANQQKAMVKIVSDFTGSSRMPMVILDCPSAVKDRRMFSARGAGILGFSVFGSKKFYALDDDMRLDAAGLRGFLEKHQGNDILLFGFTFMVWQHFYKELVRLKEEEGVIFDLSKGILIHGGGWKKLVNESVSREEFHDRLREVCGIRRIHDYYGMAEQTGCICMECEYGHLHASIFSDVIMRRPLDFGECEIGEKGIIQAVSTIPESYPGHSLLTEDEGILLGEDDCPCGRKGKYFKVVGRLKDAEIRGCSDTYAAGFP